MRNATPGDIVERDIWILDKQGIVFEHVWNHLTEKKIKKIVSKMKLTGSEICPLKFIVA